MQAEVAEAARQRADALAHGDPVALARLLHPSFRWISHTGESFDRAWYIAANIGGPTRWHAQRFEDVAVTVVGNTAILRAIVTDDVSAASGREEFRMPVTQTWVRTAAGWQCLAGHAGPRLAEPPIR